MVVENKTSQPPAPADAAPKKPAAGKKDSKEAESELSEEDQELKEKLELCVQRLTEEGPDANVAALAPAAIRSIADEVRTATTSMTSVPKPLKFLRPHYASLCEAQKNLAGGSAASAASSKEASQELADVLSVLAITAGARGGREALKWRLAGKQVRFFLFY